MDACERLDETSRLCFYYGTSGTCGTSVAEDIDYDVRKRNIGKREALELCYLPLLISIYFAVNYLMHNIMTAEYRLARADSHLLIFLFGLFHVLASIILSFFYNLGRVLVPGAAVWVPTATPTRLRIFGGLIMIGVVIHWFLA